MIGIFLNLDEDTILAIQAKAVALITEGKTIMKWSGEGNETEREFSMPPAEILDECRYALKNLFPSKYGSWIRNARVFRIA